MRIFLLIASIALEANILRINISRLFVELPATEAQKLVKRLVKYAIYKGAFLPFVIPLCTLRQAEFWSTWLTHLCISKFYLIIVRDRVERLIASPSASPSDFFHLLFLLVWLFTINAVCIFMLTFFLDSLWHLLMYDPAKQSDVFLLIFYEPFSVLSETLQVTLILGSHVPDTHNTTDSQITMLFASLREWTGVKLRDVKFFIDIMTLLMALGHYVQIWRLHGMTFHLVDAMLFIPVHVLLMAIVKLTWEYITELRIA